MSLNGFCPFDFIAAILYSYMQVKPVVVHGLQFKLVEIRQDAQFTRKKVRREKLPRESEKVRTSSQIRFVQYLTESTRVFFAR